MNLLIIRPGAIGDTLLTFPVLKALKGKYSGLHLTFVSNSAVLPLALAFNVADEVFDYGDNQWSELFSSFGIYTPALHEMLQHTALAICWLRDPDGMVEHNLRLAGVKDIIIAPGRPSENQHMHVVEYLAQTVNVKIDVGLSPVGAGVAEWLGGGPAVALASPTLAEIGEVRSFPPSGATQGSPLHSPSTPAPTDKGSGVSNAYIAIHPGSGGAEKCWPVRSFAEVIERLWQLGHAVLLVEGPADHERVRTLLNCIGLPPQPQMLKIVVDEPLLNVAYYLQQCRCYLGNDSGITHLAAMLGVPTVALFGPSDPTIWRPLGPTVKVMQTKVLEQLGVEAVVETVQSPITTTSTSP